MENCCATIGLREDEIELDLGLSIGGSFKKAEKLKPIKKDSANNRNQLMTSDSESHQPFDPQKKREIQALRRQEAKRKREEKQMKRGISNSRCQQNGDSQSKENELDATEDSEFCKKSKGLLNINEMNNNDNVNLNLGVEHPAVFPVITVPLSCLYPYQQQLQYVPYANGFAYPCVNGVTPCWGSSAGVVNEGNAASSGAFKPFQGCRDSGRKAGSGCESDPNSSRDETERNRKTGSNGSPMCSSSVISDLQSSSNHGGCGSETGTHSSHYQPAHHQGNGLVARSNVSHQMDSAQSTDRSKKVIEKTLSLNVAESVPACKPKEEAVSETHQPSVPNSSKPISAAENSTTRPMKDNSSKPPIHNHEKTLCLSRMPCVSTTGNGPNGKTVNGFLYRYTKTEVSIVCVCHGSSFSPAEFVQHAGGTDVAHPLRHITVIPSAF